MSIALFAKRRFNPLSLFAAGEQGAWYDPADLSTLSQDSAGTTPVTAVEQPVGLVLDKSRGFVRGTELIPNGDFSSTDLSYATINIYGTTPVGTISVVGGQLVMDGTATTTGMYFGVQFPTVAGKTYHLRYTIVSSTNNRADAVIGTTYANNDIFYSGAPSVGSQGFFFTATSTSAWLTLFPFDNNNQTIVFDNISIQEVAPNYASQSTAAKRPTYKLSTNYDIYCDGVDDSLATVSGGGSTTAFFLCAAIRADNTGATQTIWSDTGTNTGYRVRINASNQLELAVGNGSAYTTVNTTATLAIGQRAVITCWHDGVNIYAQIDQGATASAAFATASAGTAGFTIGQDNGASSSYFKGGTFGLVQLKNVSPADGVRPQVQRYLAQKGLITL